MTIASARAAHKPIRLPAGVYVGCTMSGVFSNFFPDKGLLIDVLYEQENAELLYGNKAAFKIHPVTVLWEPGSKKGAKP